jgi:hypothetical protein
MASICKVCGHSAGLFNLKNGICKACLNDSQTTADKAFESTKATTQTTPPEPQNNSLRFCSACGDKLAQISKFCPSCGGSISKSTPKTAPNLVQSKDSIDKTQIRQILWGSFVGIILVVLALSVSSVNMFTGEITWFTKLGAKTEGEKVMERIGDWRDQNRSNPNPYNSYNPYFEKLK